MRCPGADRHGFTLIEVMVALTIFAVIASALYGTFSRTLRSRDLAEERAEVTRTGRAALARMTDEIQAAFYPRRRGTGAQASAIFRSLPGGTEEAPADALAFSALAARPSGVAGRAAAHQVIAYFFAEERGRMGRRGASAELPDDAYDPFAAFEPRAPLPADLEPRRLLRREALVLHTDELAPATATLFLDNVASLALRFHDGRDWVDDWDSEDRTYPRPLPGAVAIELALYDAKGDVHFFATAVDLPLAGGTGNARTGGDAGAEDDGARAGAGRETRARGARGTRPGAIGASR